ncbi:MAG: crossover junction endodeoxyribonuclease RuvC [Gammaproteobacteria bacterium]|nr:crossover junction endodeoxyribonuclease RuvC [Gammaproteobacteria bacterium]
MSRILGIDPGSRLTGFGVIERQGQALRYVVSGCIRMTADDHPGRIREIFTGLSQVADEYRPDEVAIEKVFVSRSADSALKLGQARGAALSAVVIRELPVHEYTTTRIKQAIVGRGHGDKQQVQHMVMALLKLPALPQADAADALACALCHAHFGQTLGRMHAALQAIR